MKEDKRLKKLLVLQSFSPLFLLNMLKFFPSGRLILKLFWQLFHGNFQCIGAAFHHCQSGTCILLLLSILWTLSTIVFMWIFRRLWREGFSSEGKKISITKEYKETGAMFFVTFIIPLLAENNYTLCGVVYYLCLILMAIYLLIKTDMFYKNPLFFILNYNVFEYRLVDNDGNMIDPNIYIGISKGVKICSEKAIQQRKIANNVYLLKNE